MAPAANFDDELSPDVATALAELRAVSSLSRSTLALFEQMAQRDAIYRRAQAERALKHGKTRRGDAILRDDDMTDEFLKRRRNPWEEMCDTNLMAFVGSLPRFNLGRSQAIASIKSGLARKFGEPGKPNKRRGTFPLVNAAEGNP